MKQNLLTRLWYRLVSWWMYCHGAEDIEVEYMDKKFYIPVYPLTCEQQVELHQVKTNLETQNGLSQEHQVFHSLTRLQNIAEDVTEYKVDDFPTELVIQILEKAPKEAWTS